MNRFKINWINIIKEHLSKTRKLIDYRIQYVVLISKFIEHFEVDLDGELVEVVKAKNEITTTTLHKIGLKKLNDDDWICKGDEEEAGQQPTKRESTTYDGAGPSFAVAGDGGDLG